MRAIDPKQVEASIPESWLNTAEAKTGDLYKLYDSLVTNGGVPPPRKKGQRSWRDDLSEAIEELGSVWQDRELKEALMKISFGKCWYCEAKVAQRADNAVDHFRPKNRVAEDRTHPGYWWLACSFRNYRFACQFCNSARRTPETSGGKQDHFPLWDERKRARQRSDSLAAEQPLLLDPTRVDDLKVLTFERNGKPVPRFSKETNAYQHARAEASIRHYHLDRSELNKDRRDIMAKVEEQLLNAEQLTREAASGDNPMAEAGYSNAAATLVNYIRPQAEFSLAARAFLAVRRGTSTVADEVLQTPI